MRVLAIDTSLEACAVGIAAGDGARVLRSETIGRGHAERLFAMVAEALDAAGMTLADVDRFAVIVGPGSFTGIRVGIAAVRGFALATGKPAIGLSTLDVHAAAARAIAGAVPVLSVVPGKGGDVFAALFAADGTPVAPPGNGPAAGFAASASAAGAVLAGSGADTVAAAGATGRIVHRASAPDLATVLALAAAAVPTGEPPRPLYLRAPDATPAAPALPVRR
ncbi:MAG: tRNA (adenosine(37)-N6)-threonylcarbamoyltransferase complex dimerization subunit type 1 TsaB [Bauldia sp.]|nr:tRNA (adenosine(37)-N6)-threonylcarbamoyltransferase complex dimerization subunit type 1 TsaB [Bauldia sp.]